MTVFPIWSLPSRLCFVIPGFLLCHWLPVPFSQLKLLEEYYRAGRGIKKGVLFASYFCQTHWPSCGNLFQGCRWIWFEVFPIQPHCAPSRTLIPASWTPLLRRIKSQPHKAPPPNSVSPVPAKQLSFSERMFASFKILAFNNSNLFPLFPQF